MPATWSIDSKFFLIEPVKLSLLVNWLRLLPGPPRLKTFDFLWSVFSTSRLKKTVTGVFRLLKNSILLCTSKLFKQVRFIKARSQNWQFLYATILQFAVRSRTETQQTCMSIFIEGVKVWSINLKIKKLYNCPEVMSCPYATTITYWAANQRWTESQSCHQQAEQLKPCHV